MLRKSSLFGTPLLQTLNVYKIYSPRHQPAGFAKILKFNFL